MSNECKKQTPKSDIRWTTPQERRRVAETLRGQARDSMPYGMLNTLKGAVGIEDGTWRDVWRRLADLIDPAGGMDGEDDA